MSWMAKLYETYGQATELQLPNLMPISHTLQNVHINIVIDGNGNFIRARVLEKTQIVLPATEKSAGRSSGEAPHPLADKIQYVAGDYHDFGGVKKPYFNGYQKALAQWCCSDVSSDTVKSVLRYVSKKEVVSDLVKNKILHENDGVLLTQWNSDEEQPLLFKVLTKEKGILDQGSALVCWTVESQGIKIKTWEDAEIQQSWIDYDSLSGGEVGLCFIKGKKAVLATNHPAKIRHSGDKAKLISANDMSGFTFRGRFTDSKNSVKEQGYQSVGVSFDVTQKAHNALRWLLSRQGFRNGDQAYISWAISGKEIPNPTDDFWQIIFEDPIEDHNVDMGQSFANKLNTYMEGYLSKENLNANDSIVIMGIDSATPGRMGITYYRETFAQEFIDTLTQWHLDFAWPQRQKKGAKNSKGEAISRTVWPVLAPAPYKIADTVYGDVLKINKTLKKNLMERLMPCIVEGGPIPVDIVNYSIKRATNRVAYKDTWKWEQNLGIACALYKGFCIRTKNLKYKKEYQVALEEDNTSRDYLYGRLLAVAEKIERVALNIADENRTTTAERLMQRFADRPFGTWRNIELGLQPYTQRLKSSRAGFLVNRQKELDSILNAFKQEDFVSDKPLSGEFLLGFHCQRLALNSKNESTEINES